MKLESLVERFIQFSAETSMMEGYLVAPNSATSLPSVFIVPTWLNVDASIRARARRIAQLGYTVFVTDVFGVGIKPAPPQLPDRVVAPLISDRLLYRQRLLAGLATLALQPECDEERIVAIGYCLGGCGVLEMLRADAPLRGVVSLHGVLSSTLPASPISAKQKVLVLHGYADPLVSPEQVVRFQTEMLALGANWQINVYGGAKHSFTGEGMLGQQNDLAGLHPQSERRSWQAMTQFLEEVCDLRP